MSHNFLVFFLLLLLQYWEKKTLKLSCLCLRMDVLLKTHFPLIMNKVIKFCINKGIDILFSLLLHLSWATTTHTAYAGEQMLRVCMPCKGIKRNLNISMSKGLYSFRKRKTEIKHKQFTTILKQRRFLLMLLAFFSCLVQTEDIYGCPESTTWDVHS